MVIGMDEEPTRSVLYGARVANDRGHHVDLLLRDPSDETASSLAVMDRALHIARMAYPRLEVRVHLGAQDLHTWLHALSFPVDLVVLGTAEAAQLAAQGDGSAGPGRAMLALPGCEVVVV